jgi:hypothetical protein
MRNSVAVFLCTFVAMALGSAVASAQNPFGGGPNIAPRVQEEPQATKTDDDGLGTGQTLAIMFGGAAVLGGIALAIVADARRRNTARSDGHEEDRQKARVEKEAEHRRRKQQARKKGKAAKQARRSNRPH